MKKKVLILFGGNSPEHNISVKSAKSIIENIDRNLFNVKIVGITRENTWYEYIDKIAQLNENWIDAKLMKIDNVLTYLKNFDVVFPITHGNNGEDGKLQGLLDFCGVKYVGSGVLASSVGMDKVASKMLLSSLNIKQVPYIFFDKTDKIENTLQYPVIVKPANGGSSIGITKVNNKKELKKAIKKALEYDQKIIIEKFVVARELEIAVLEDNKKLIISDIGEIIACNDFYDYNAKYEKDSQTIICNNLSYDTVKEIKNLAKKIFKYIGASGYARIDLFLVDDEVYFNEINTIPGFTEISMFPKLMINSGISYKDLITKLINNA